jgi:biopolymer transport protein TolQ
MLTENLFRIAQYGAEFILYFLLLLSVISVSIILERYFTLRAVRARSKQVQTKIEDALTSNNLDDLEHISKSRDSIEAKALSYGIRFVKENGPNGVAEIFNSFAIIEKQKLEKSLNFLGTIGSNAVFIGLLGTVLGIMKAFKDLSVSQGNVSVVMTGIAEALVATAVGLFVAIPAVIAYNYFRKQVSTIVGNVESVRELCIAYANQKGK